jgi:hypothetical protein
VDELSEIRCECGKRIQIPDQLLGKRLKCPKCRKKHRAPKSRLLIRQANEAAGDGDTAEVDTDKAKTETRIVFACKCGKTFKAKLEFAGNRLRCSKCQTVNVIPGSVREERQPDLKAIDDSLEISRDDFFDLLEEDSTDLTLHTPLAVGYLQSSYVFSPLHPTVAAKPKRELPRGVGDPNRNRLLDSAWFQQLCKDEPTWLVVLATLCGIVGTLLLPVVLYQTVSITTHSISSQFWPVTKVTITHSQVVTTTNNQRTVSRPEIHYQYKIGNQLMSGERINYADPSWSESDSREMVDRYPTGKQIYAHYNQNDPSEIVLEPGMGTRQWVAILLLIFALLAPLVLYIQGMTLWFRWQTRRV